MAIRSLLYSTGYTLKTVLRDYSTGAMRWWNTATPGFEAFNLSNIANYGLAATDADSTGVYVYTIPATLGASTSGFPYETTTYQIAASSLAASDLANSVAGGEFEWNGSDFITAVNASPTYVTVSPGYANGSITIRKGDSYGSTSGQRLTITKPTGANWPSDLASLPWTVVFTATKINKGDGTASSTIGPITCTINSATSVDVPLTAAQTALVLHTKATDDVNGWQWDLQASV
jgi:hypothetical protein